MRKIIVLLILSLSISPMVFSETDTNLERVWKIGALSRWVEKKPKKATVNYWIDIRIVRLFDRMEFKYVSTNCYFNPTNTSLYFVLEGKWTNFSQEKYTFVYASNYIKTNK